MTATDAIYQLIEKFEAEKEKYESGEHKEAQVRQSLIDPLFEALGWDMTDPKQVRQEFSLEDKGHNVFPDYSFHIHDRTDPIFYMEAKGVYVDIENNEKTAQQVRRYSSTSKHDIAILTDFEELSIYNGLQVVDKSDKAHIARLDHLRYTEYIEKWDWIYGLLSREAVIGGSLEAYAGSKRPKGTQTVDEAFLNTLEDWRSLLAEDIYAQNKALNLTDRELNIAVQRTIDRIVFLRITEARGIAYSRHTLDRYLDGDVYHNLKTLFREANDRFNSGLFHFVEERGSEEGDAISMKISISPQPLREIIDSIYYPESPYEFSVMPADILGQVYERFLGNVISRRDDGILIDQKPEVRKAGGVYYTPTYIVDYIVENTVGKLLEGKNPTQVSKLRILDPACGSGSFLLGAYQYLMDWHLDYYRARIAENPNSTFLSRTRYETDTDGTIQVLALNVHEKRNILLNNLYGVDLDQQAVEVTKLSLLLKMLENETEKTTASTRPEQIPLIRGDDRLLPPLHDNIKWGNSLIGNDFYDDKKMTQMAMFPDEDVQEELYRVRAFDWEIEFSTIMSGGGFDAVIGNPPYGATFNKNELKYTLEKFQVGKKFPDSYVFFMLQAFDLLKENHRASFIVPNTFCDLESCDEFRKWLLTEHTLETLWQSGWAFKDAIVDTLVFSCKKSRTNQPLSVVVEIDDKRYEREVDSFLANELVKIDYRNSSIERDLPKKIIANTIPLAEIASVNAGVKMYERGKGNPPQTRELIKERPYSLKGEQPDGWKLLYRGKHVNRYYLKFPNEFVNYGEWLAAPRSPMLFEGTKIVMRRTDDKLLASLDAANSICVNSCHVIKFSDSAEQLSYYYLLGLLNSRLLQVVFELQNPQMVNKVFAEVKVIYVLRLPIRTIDFENPDDVALHDALVQHVQNMLDWHKQLSSAPDPLKKVLEGKIKTTDKAIDQLVYKLYELTAEEIEIVEGRS